MTLIEQIAEAKSRILALIPDSDDQQKAREAIADMLSAQAQSDVEEVELCVPAKAVNATLDLGAVSLMDTTKGMLFRAKGGLSVLVEPRLVGIHSQLSQLRELMSDDFAGIENEEDRDNMQAYAQAWLYVLQAPMFVSMSPEDVADVAALLLRILNRRTKELTEQPLQDETPLEDADFHRAVEAQQL